MGDFLRFLGWTTVLLAVSGIAEVAANRAGYPGVGRFCSDMYFEGAGVLLGRYCFWPERFRA